MWYHVHEIQVVYQKSHILNFIYIEWLHVAIISTYVGQYTLRQCPCLIGLALFRGSRHVKLTSNKDFFELSSSLFFSICDIV